jgi:hypothetical protein
LGRFDRTEVTVTVWVGSNQDRIDEAETEGHLHYRHAHMGIHGIGDCDTYDASAGSPVEDSDGILLPFENGLPVQVRGRWTRSGRESWARGVIDGTEGARVLVRLKNADPPVVKVFPRQVRHGW